MARHLFYPTCLAAVLALSAALPAPAHAHDEGGAWPNSMPDGHGVGRLVVSRAPATPPAPKPSVSPAALPTGVTAEDLEELEKAFGTKPEAEAAPPPLPPLSQPASSLGMARIFQSMNPDLSLILDVAAAAFSGPNRQGGGHDPKNNGFNLQQLEMSLGAPVDPFLRFDSNIVFGQFGVEIEEAYATTLQAPFDLQARAGQFLTHFGRTNATHPHTWEFVDQSLVIGKYMGSEGNRGLGAEVSWLTPLPWYVEVLGSATDAAGGSTARSFYGNDGLGVRSPLDTQITAALRQFFPLGADWSLAWGLSGMTGPNSSGIANRSDILGTDIYLKWRPLTGSSFYQAAWTTEAMTRRRQTPGGLLVDHGGYSSLTWRFAQQWAVAGRYELVTGMPNDPLDPDWIGDRGRWAANVTYWPTEFSRYRLQGSVDLPSWQPQPVYAVMVTMETVIGAHGAHKF